jgi:flagellar protein FlaH
MGELLSIAIKNDELHRRLGGGIPAGSIVLIEGDRGSGKSVFSQRLLYGFLSNGHSVSYLSSQYTTVEFINQMYSLGYEIIPFLIRRKLLFVSFYPLLSALSSEEKFLSRLINEPRIWEPDVIIIDAINPIIGKRVSDSALRMFTEHMKKMSSLGKVTMLTVNEKEMDEDLLLKLEEISTLLIRLQVKVFGGDLKNSAMIIKYNNAKGLFQRIIPFRVEPKVGFIVEIATVV